MGDSTQKHKLWFVLDKNLILPEYLVEFEYTHLKNFDNKLIRIENELGKQTKILFTNFIIIGYLIGD